MKDLIDFINEAKSNPEVNNKFTILFGELGEIKIEKGLPSIKFPNNKNILCVKIMIDKEDNKYFISCNPRKSQFIMGSTPYSSYFNVGRLTNSFKTIDELLDDLLSKKEKDSKTWNDVLDTLKNDEFLPDKLDRFILGYNRKNK